MSTKLTLDKAECVPRRRNELNLQRQSQAKNIWTRLNYQHVVCAPGLYGSLPLLLIKTVPRGVKNGIRLYG